MLDAGWLAWAAELEVLGSGVGPGGALAGSRTLLSWRSPASRNFSSSDALSISGCIEVVSSCACACTTWWHSSDSSEELVLYVSILLSSGVAFGATSFLSLVGDEAALAFSSSTLPSVSVTLRREPVQDSANLKRRKYCKEVGLLDLVFSPSPLDPDAPFFVGLRTGILLWVESRGGCNNKYFKDTKTSYLDYFIPEENWT